MLILFLDDRSDRHAAFKRLASGRLGATHEIFQVYTATEAMQHMKERRFDVVFLDHDLDEHPGNRSATYGWDTGYEVVRFMVSDLLPKEHAPGLTIIHSVNISKADLMHTTLAGAGHPVEAMPFASEEFMDYMKAEIAGAILDRSIALD